MKTYTATLHNGITITTELEDESINSPYYDKLIGQTVIVELPNDDGKPIKANGLIISFKVVEEHG
jgi:hypothetical protein